MLWKSYTRSTLRSFNCVVLITLGLGVAAQSGNTHFLRATNGAPSQKYLIEAVRSLDPSAKISIDHDLVKFFLDSRFSIDDLTSTLASSGLTGYTEVHSADKARLTPALPIRVDTGSPIHDDAVYDANKRAWIEANPKAYKTISE